MLHVAYQGENSTKLGQVSIVRNENKAGKET